MKKELVKEETVFSIYKLVFAVFFFALALLINYHGGVYTSSVETTEVKDLILDLFGPYDLGFIYLWLYIAVIILFIAYPLIFRRSKLNFAISMMALFIIVRAIFISLTHLGVPGDAIYPPFPWIFAGISFTNDLFFSGHTGLPFLGFLVFRENKKIRYFFLASSIILGATVLLMHAHYSIDVFAAFFITYGVYKIGNKLFN